MYPQIEELVRLVENENEELQLKYDEINARYTGTDIKSVTMRDTERNIAYRQYQTLLDITWYEVGNIDDPLIKWIIGNCKDYRSEAIEILKILPATSEELQAKAREKEFCTSWDSLVKRAQDAGVYPYGPGETPEYHQMIHWYRQNVSSNTRYIREFSDKLDAVIKASVDKILEARATEESQDATTEGSTEVKVDDRELVNA